MGCLGWFTGSGLESFKKNTGAIWGPREVQNLAPLRATCRQPASTGEEAQCCPTVEMFQVSKPQPSSQLSLLVFWGRFVRGEALLLRV